MSTPSPAGCRRIVPSAFYYSNSSGNWTDNLWSVTQGGPSCNCQPNGAGIVNIDSGTIVSVNKSRKVDVVNIMKDGSMQGGNSNMNFYITNEINVYDNGFFSFLGDLIVRGNVNIYGTGTSWYHKVDSIEGNLYIGPEATLKNFAASTNDLTVSGNLTVLGILENTHASIALFNTSDIDGTGDISTDFLLIHDGIKTFKSTADLNIDASVILKGYSRIDNFGIINIRGNMDAEISTSRWINEPGSVLYYGGSAPMFATHGYLVANSENNSVHYSGLTDQSIIGPENLTYYHLVLEDSGTKFMWTDLHLLGNLTFDASFAHMQKIISVDGTIMQYFGGSVTPTLYDLAMSNSGEGLTLNLPVFYEGNLKLSTGKIFTTMTNILTAKDNAKVTSGTTESFVNGPMQKIGNDAFVYPVGKNDIWARIGISEPQSTAAAFIAEYFYESYSNTSSVTLPLDHVSTVEYWNLLRNAKANDSVKVTLFWESATRSAINSYLSLLIAGWSETSWQSKGQSAITYSDPGNITSNVVHNFGPFTFGSSNNGDNPLPITLINYDVKLVNDIAVNTWATATEINNDYFTVEKSRDAINFERVEIVEGAGNSNQILHYSCNDNNPLPGISYYRLKQTDFDGKFSYSKIVAVEFEDLPENVIYPNPFNTSLNIRLDEVPLPDNNTVFKIYSLTGAEVVSMPLKNQRTTIKAVDIPAGAYYYKIEVNGQLIQSGKLISQNGQ